MKLSIGDTIITKKPHACGTSEWAVIRTGADYKLKCLGCGRIIMLSYEDLQKRIKKIRSAQNSNGT